MSKTLPETAAPSGRSSLRSGSIGAVGAIAMAMAFMGPATSIAFNTQPAVNGAAINLPLSMLMAMIACLLVANTIAQFARKIPSAGFALSFNTRAFGAASGTFTGLVLLLGYSMVGPMLLSAIGYFTSDFISTASGIAIPWWLLSIAYGLIIWFINSRGIAESVRVALVFLVIEVGVLLGLFVTIIAKGGDSGLSLAPLNPAVAFGGAGAGLSGLGIGMLWGILYFVGFESAATLGEEAREPSKTIPRALFVGVIVLGLFYVIACYAIVVGFGAENIGRLMADPTPLVTLGQKYWGLTWLISLTILASQFANMLAGSSAAVRIMFSLGRARILPRSLGQTDARGIPQRALASYMGFAVVAMLIVGALIGPLGVYGLAGTVLGIVMILIYIGMNIGVTRFYLQQHRSEFSTIRHGVIPAVSSLVMLLPLYGQLVPLPPLPNLIAPCLIAAWLAASAIYVIVLKARDPRRLHEVTTAEAPPTGAADENESARIGS